MTQLMGAYQLQALSRAWSYTDAPACTKLVSHDGLYEASQLSDSFLWKLVLAADPEVVIFTHHVTHVLLVQADVHARTQVTNHGFTELSS